MTDVSLLVSSSQLCAYLRLYVSQRRSGWLAVQRHDGRSELTADSSRPAWGACLQAGRLQACPSSSLSSSVNDSGRGLLRLVEQEPLKLQRPRLEVKPLWQRTGSAASMRANRSSPPASTHIFQHRRGVNERPLGLIAHLSRGVCWASVFHLPPSLSSSSSA